MKKMYDSVKVDQVEIHEIAHSTPTMTKEDFNRLKLSLKEHGQSDPIKLYRGKCVDGRHRLKALRELGIKDVLYKNEDSKLSLEDIRDRVLHVYENRRHETPTQKAIMAWKEYQRLRELGEKVGQGIVAEWMGSTIKQLGRAKQLEEVSGKDIIELLFQGNRVNIGTEARPNNTDSLSSLINYFKKHREEVLDRSKATTISEDYTDEEMDALNNTMRKLESEYSHRMLNRLDYMLKTTLNETKTEEIF